MTSAGKRIELEHIKLGEVTQSQKDECHVFSVVCGSYLQIFSWEQITWSNYRE